MDKLKKNSRVLIVIATFLVSLFSFFSFYSTTDYKRLKKLQAGLENARLAKEVYLSTKVNTSPESNINDPLENFISKNSLSKGTIKELDEKIKNAQILYKNSYITILTQLKLGLDLVGGAQLTFQAIPGPNTPITDETLAGLVKVFENRVNASGTTEAIVQQVGKDRILVEIPGADPQIVKRRLLKTAFLEFKEPGEIKNGTVQALEAEKPPVEIMQEVPVEKTEPPIDTTNLPTTLLNEQIAMPKAIEVAQNTATQAPVQPQVEYVWKDTGITGRDLKRAQAVSDGAGNWLIQFSFQGPAIERFGRLTERLIGKPIAIFLDGRLISSPTVRSAITGGEGQIEGRFTPEEAQDLAVQLNAGALPVPVKIIQERSVGATLGQDSINKSVIAGLYGIIIVMIFMIIFYRLPGIIASLALLLYTLISIAIFENTVTLTLAGVAGFILSIGMAVDANILIFERTKEELKAGKNFFTAIDTGFDRAFSSIFDSNVNTLIACFVLLMFGTGLVRGFAITLAMGVLVSMFSAIFVTKTLLSLATKFESLRKPVLFGVKI